MSESQPLDHWDKRAFPRLHSNRGGEFSSDLLAEFCRDEGIIWSFTFPPSPQQNGIVERRIGLIIEVACTSMIHVAAPHLLWPFAVRYAAHQLNLWPRVSEPETSPTLRWTGKVGDASVFRGLAPSGVSQVDPPSLVEPLEISSNSSSLAEGGDLAADDTAATCRSPRLETPPGGDATRGAATGGAGSGGAATGGAGSWGAATGGADSGGPASPSGGGAVGDPAGGSPGGGGYDRASAGAASPGGAAGAGGAGAIGPRGATSAGGAGPTSLGGTVGAGGAGGAAGARGAGVGGTGGVGAASPGGARTGGAGAAGAGGAVRARGATGAAVSGGTGGTASAGGDGVAGAGGTAGAGGAGAVGAGGTASDGGAGGATRAAGTGGAVGTAGAGGAGAGGTGGTGGAGATGPGGARTRGTGAARAGGAAGAGGAGGATRATGIGGAGGTTGARGPRATGASGVAGARGAGGAAGAAGAKGAGAAGAGGVGAAGTALRRPFFYPQPQSSLSPQSTFLSLTERREPESRASTPVRARRVACPHPPALPGTHGMALRPSSVPERVVLPEPHASSLPHTPNPESDLAHAASRTVTRLLAIVVTDPDLESTAGFALVSELLDFAARSRLDYVASLLALSSDVLEDRQFELECLTAALPRFTSMLLCPEGDPDALDIRAPRSYAEAIAGEYSSQWQTAMDAEMASWKSTGTYVDEVPPPGANIVDHMWIFRVKRLPGSPLAFKAHYVARGFTQCDYKLHSLDFSTAFLQGSVYEEIWLRRPPGFTGSFPAGQGSVVLIGHSDASWADDQATQRSSQGYTFSLGSGSVSWRSTRSSSVLISSYEARIYTGAIAAQELRWLTYLLTDLGEQPRSPPVLYVVNNAMIALC
ncbi:unnamed protein product [Closterium sp. NIES-54]